MRLVMNHKKSQKKERQFVLGQLCYRKLKDSKDDNPRPIFIFNLKTGKVVYDELTVRYTENY